MNVYEFVFQNITGANLPLRNYQGQPILVVNTASECGYTPQYAKLQRLWEDYRESNLLILGTPCNDFGGQEPGEDEEIAEFCRENYGVTFPLTTKVTIRGLGCHPFYEALREEAGEDAMPKWNFWKYLFNSQGELVEYWRSDVEPDDPRITHQIERNLHAWIL